MSRVEKIYFRGPWTAEIDFALGLCGRSLSEWAAFSPAEVARQGRLSLGSSAAGLDLSPGELRLAGPWLALSGRAFDQKPAAGELSLGRWQNCALLPSADAAASSARNWAMTELFNEGNPLQHFFLLSLNQPASVSALTQLLGAEAEALAGLALPGAEEEQGFLQLQDRLAELGLGVGQEWALLRLNHRAQGRFFAACPALFEACARQPERLLERLTAQAANCRIAVENAERVFGYFLQSHPATAPLIANYLSLLFENRSLKKVEGNLLSRLDQLRQSGLHQGIPPTVFDRMDRAYPLRLLPRGNELEQAVAQAKQILDNLLAAAGGIPLKPAIWELEKLLRAFHACAMNSDKRLEAYMLEAARKVDEQSHQPGMVQVAASIREISALFEAYEKASALVNELVFHDEAGLDKAQLRQLRGQLQALRRLSPAATDDLIYGPIAENRYAGYYGRRKLAALRQALDGAEPAEAAALAAIADFTREENNFRVVYRLVRGRLDPQLFISYYEKDREGLRQRVESLLRREQLLSGELHPAAFQKIHQDLRLEEHYREEILPAVWREGKNQLRQEFIRDSGLDWRQVEAVEQQFCRDHRLPEGFFERQR